MRRRLAASASRAWVSSFSSTSNSSRAAFHSCGDTVGGMFMVIWSSSTGRFPGRDIAPLTQRYVEDQKSIGGRRDGRSPGLESADVSMSAQPARREATSLPGPLPFELRSAVRRRRARRMDQVLDRAHTLDAPRLLPQALDVVLALHDAAQE